MVFTKNFWSIFSIFRFFSNIELGIPVSFGGIIGVRNRESRKNFAKVARGGCTFGVETWPPKCKFSSIFDWIYSINIVIFGFPKSQEQKWRSHKHCNVHGGEKCLWNSWEKKSQNFSIPAPVISWSETNPLERFFGLESKSHSVPPGILSVWVGVESRILGKFFLDWRLHRCEDR